MTYVTNLGMIYIGNFLDVDTDETNWIPEYPADLLGSYDRSGMDMVAVTAYDHDWSGYIDDDEAGSSEFVEYTRDGVLFSEKPDSSMSYSARIVETDGNVVITNVTVIQMQNGDVFVTDQGNAGALDNLDIQTLELTEIVSTFHVGFIADQSVDNSTVCFAAGTRISTPCGERRVETLKIGDYVTTCDGGAQRLEWVKTRTHRRTGARTAPIEIAPGALGHGIPARRLVVSPQHRILLRSRVAKRMTGGAEVFVAAKHLVGQPGITRRAIGPGVEYWHLALPKHHILIADGALAESYYPGPWAVSRVGATLQNRSHALNITDLARPVLPGPQRRRLLSRIALNGKPLVEGPVQRVPPEIASPEAIAATAAVLCAPAWP